MSEREKTRIFSHTKILFCGFEDCEPLHSYGPAVRDYFIIHFVHEGKGSFFCGEKSYTLSGGDCFLITPGEITSYRADRLNPWKYSWVAFLGEDIEKALCKAGLYPTSPVRRSLPSECDMCFCEMRKNLYGNECALLSNMYRFLSLLTENSSSKTLQGEYVKCAAEYMKYNLHSGIGVSDAAAFVGIDRSYLSRLFSAELGVSPSEYLFKLRMEEADRLIRSPRLSLSDIAASVGYSDQFVFSKAFSRYFGVPPKTRRLGLKS